jgi:hypothetical protein
MTMKTTFIPKAMMFVAATALLPVSAAQAGLLHIKNCSDDEVWVCIYNKKDQTGDVPRRKEHFDAGEENDMGCTGDRCRIRVTDRNDDNCNDAAPYKIKSKKYVSIQWANRKEAAIYEEDSFRCN